MSYGKQTFRVKITCDNGTLLNVGLIELEDPLEANLDDFIQLSGPLGSHVVHIEFRRVL